MEKESKLPEISIIIPVYNDPVGLTNTINSLVKQDFKGKYEILIVDNGSDDNTPEIIQKFEKKYSNLVEGFKENEIQSSYAARNKGIKKSRGEILVFIDADMWADRD